MTSSNPPPSAPSASAIDLREPRQCLAWLVALNPTDLNAAHIGLERLLTGLLEQPPEPIQHLEILEEARAKLDFVQNELAQRYASAPLPPVAAEDALLRRVVALWRLMSRSYGVVAQRGALDPAFGDRRALLGQRAVFYQGRAMLEYFRARREMPQGYWRELHRLHTRAEDWGVATTRVPEPFNDTWRAQSATEAYVGILLTDAANPYGRNPREFGWILRWAQRFAPYCRIRRDLENDKGGAYGFDQEVDYGLRPLGLLPPAPSLRRIDARRLAAHIQAVVGQIKQGLEPASLGLGEDAVHPACTRLLVSLYRPWGLASAGRRFQRHASIGSLQMCTTAAATAFYINGRELQQPYGQRRDYASTEALLTFGERATESAPSEVELNVRAAQLGHVLEQWRVLDQSLTGFRVERMRPGARVEYRQLIGVKPPDGQRFLLAEVSWLMYRHTGELTAGVSLMPGIPQVVSVRLPAPGGAGGEPYQIGFVLPATAALKVEPSLILPAGWFQQDRLVEVVADRPWQAKLLKLVGRGSNFDRASFAAV